jgi:15-cis-phytoene synthase
MRNHHADPQAIMDAHAKSFSWAARFLSKQARGQAAQLYAFARLMDDLVDEAALGSMDERLAQFEVHRAQVLGAIVDGSRSHAVGAMLQTLGVDQQVLRSFMDSLLADAQPRHLQSLPDVLGFAYGVAGTVGQMMRPILGASAEADNYAVTLGMAMQLTNIARDVMEDAHRGRCYLPAQWLPAGWQLAKLLEGCVVTRGQAFAAVQRLLAEAEPLYASAEQGFDAIPMPNRRAVKIACVLYRGIGRKIMKMPSQEYWAERVHLSAATKASGVMQVLMGMSGQSKPPLVSALTEHQSVLQRIPGFPCA